jgi:hypothetical protein
MEDNLIINYCIKYAAVLEELQTPIKNKRFSFSTILYDTLYTVLYEFYTEYKALPKSFIDIKFFIDNEVQIDDKGTKRAILAEFREVFKPIEIQEDVAIDYIEKIVRNAMFKDFIYKMYEKVDGTIELGQIEDSVKTCNTITSFRLNNKQYLLNKDSTMESYREQLAQDAKVIEFPFTQINEFLNRKGHSSPETIAVVGEEKSFKTGLMLNLAKHYILKGYNVFYADRENGADAILLRGLQALLNATTNELYENENDESYNNVIGTITGNLFIKKFTKKDTLLNVKNEVLHIQDKHNLKIDIIIYDYINIFNSIERTHNRKEQITNVWFDNGEINTALNCISISPIHCANDARGKLFFTSNDTGDDKDIGRTASYLYGLSIVPREYYDESDRMDGTDKFLLYPIVQRLGAKVILSNELHDGGSPVGDYLDFIYAKGQVVPTTLNRVVITDDNDNDNWCDD